MRNGIFSPRTDQPWGARASVVRGRSGDLIRIDRPPAA
jgi:hypothetical protein